MTFVVKSHRSLQTAVATVIRRAVRGASGSRVRKRWPASLYRCSFNEQGLILEANLTAAALLGMTCNALIKKPLFPFIFPDDQEHFYLHRKRLLETGTLQVVQLRLVRQDAGTFWARLEASRAYGAGGLNFAVSW